MIAKIEKEAMTFLMIDPVAEGCSNSIDGSEAKTTHQKKTGKTMPVILLFILLKNVFVLKTAHLLKLEIWQRNIVCA